jgi:DNA-binding NarL/FixJ family response regulator
VSLPLPVRTCTRHPSPRQRTSVKGSWRDNAFDTPESLTEREREVLRLMASGIGNREIADALLLSEGTVKNHISSIFS